MKKRKIIIILSITLIVLLTTISIYVFGVALPEKHRKEEYKQNVKKYNDDKIALYEKENNQYDDFEVDVAFLGDSLTDMYDVKAYYSQYLVVNRGIGGNTTFDLEKRLKVSVYDLKPKVAVILIGANNFNSMFDNYENILIGLKENIPDTKIVLLSLTSMSMEWGKNNEKAAYNNVIIELLAKKYDYEFVDMYSPLLNLETGEIYSEYTTDGGHLTQKGYEVFTRIVTPVLKEILGY